MLKKNRALQYCLLPYAIIQQQQNGWPTKLVGSLCLSDKKFLMVYHNKHTICFTKLRYCASCLLKFYTQAPIEGYIPFSKTANTFAPMISF